MASLFEAIVLQNLSVLTRGHTLRPHVLLLGGPNRFIRGMREAWQANIPRMWKDRKVEIPEGIDARGAHQSSAERPVFRRAWRGGVRQGRGADVGRYRGAAKLVHYIDFGRAEEKAISGGKGLVAEDAELDAFKSAYRRKKFTPAEF